MSRFLWILIAATALFVGCAAYAVDEPLGPDKPDPELVVGRDVWSQSCSRCHGNDGGGVHRTEAVRRQHICRYGTSDPRRQRCHASLGSSARGRSHRAVRVSRCSAERGPARLTQSTMTTTSRHSIMPSLNAPAANVSRPASCPWLWRCMRLQPAGSRQRASGGAWGGSLRYGNGVPDPDRHLDAPGRREPCSSASSGPTGRGRCSLPRALIEIRLTTTGTHPWIHTFGYRSLEDSLWDGPGTLAKTVEVLIVPSTRLCIRVSG